MKEMDPPPEWDAEAPPVDPQEFMFVLRLIAAASTYKMPMASPTRYGFALKTDDGEVHQYQLTEDPLNRAGLAVREHCGQDSAKFHALMKRYLAWADIRADERLSRWIRQHPDGTYVHDAILHAAATVPLVGLRFDIKALSRRADELVAAGLCAAPEDDQTGLP
jgi:hypothetical protein